MACVIGVVVVGTSIDNELVVAVDGVVELSSLNQWVNQSREWNDFNKKRFWIWQDDQGECTRGALTQ